MSAADRVLLWSNEAEQDLGEIYDYIAVEAGPDTADGVVRNLDRACMALLQYPYKGRARPELAFGLRSVLVHPYVVFYRPVPGAIEIVRLLHGRRDIEAIFRDD